MRRFFVSLSYSFVALASLWAAGCAAPGAPTPPKPIVPKAVSDLAAHQQASSVILTFTLPKQSIDKEKLKEPPELEIYRGERQPGAAGKLSTRLVYSVPSALVDTYLRDGQIEFRDPLEPALLTGQELVYMVRTRASKKKASADSNVISVLALPIPAAPTAVRATVTESAILISWTPPSTGAAAQGPANPFIAGFRVYRAEIEPGAALPRDLTAASLKQFKMVAPFELLGPSAGSEFHDANFAFGSQYVYAVRSVAEVQGQSVESNDSELVAVLPKDIFPPAAPRGLVAIVAPPSELPATQTGSARVELSWDINPEPDLAGYWIYRSEQPDTPGPRLNSQLLLTSTFRDMTAMQGKRYFYRVSAVDRAGNESSFSSAVSVDVPRKDP